MVFLVHQVGGNGSVGAGKATVDREQIRVGVVRVVEAETVASSAMAAV